MSALLANGNYHQVDERIKTYCLKAVRDGPQTVHANLVHFGCPVLSVDVLKDFDNTGLRAASLVELLAFGAAIAGEKGHGTVLALNSPLIISDERWVAAAIDGFGGRILHLLRWNDLWRSHCRFLAISAD